MRLSLLAAFLIGLSGLAGAALLSLNVFRPVENRFSGACEPVLGVAGPEDFAFAPGLGRAFVSSLDRRKGAATRGAVFSIAPEDPLDSGGWRDRTGGVPARFRPAGVSYYEQGAERRLFVVNRAANAVEIYEVESDGDLRHIHTVEERRLANPADVVAVGSESFYVTNNDDAGRGVIAGLAEFLTRAPTGAIYYYDGQTMRVAADNLRFANGLAVSRDGDRLYAAETSGGALKIFDRDKTTGALELVRTEPMRAGVDKITVSSDGALWIAAHPKPLALVRALGDPARKAPSLVIRYVDGPGSAATLSSVYSNDGAEISTSSAAAMIGSRLLIGSLLDDKYLICELQNR